MVFAFSSCKKKDDNQLPAPNIDSVKVYLDKVIPHDTVYFKAYTNLSSSFEWDFADGTAHGSGDSVMHVFAQVGFFDVICFATANDRTSSKYVTVNNTAYTKAKVYSVTVTAMPLTNPNGGNWDTDLTGPDLQSIIRLPGVPDSLNPDIYSAYSSNVTPSSGMSVELVYGSLIITKLNSSIPVTIIDADDTEDEIVQLFTLSNGFRDFLNQYPTSSSTHDFPLTQGGTSIKLKLQWLP